MAYAGAEILYRLQLEVWKRGSIANKLEKRDVRVRVRVRNVKGPVKVKCNCPLPCRGDDDKCGDLNGLCHSIKRSKSQKYSGLRYSKRRRRPSLHILFFPFFLVATKDPWHR
jgi:hypothetical protein